MLAPLSSLEAYRRDATGRMRDQQQDLLVARWLESATQLERAVRARGAERDRLLAGVLAAQGVVHLPTSAMSIDTIVDTVVQFARAVEDATYFQLAHSILASLLSLLPESAVLVRGRILAYQARIARLLGSNDASRALYQVLEELGTANGLPELSARAYVGLGILAQHRGDFPLSRRLLNQVLEMEGAAADSVAAAHTELMIAAAAASDFDAAAVHGWQAFERAKCSSREPEALNNLAQLMLVTGHTRVALRGFAAALARDPSPRHLLGSLGGASLASAKSLENPPARSLVRNFGARVETVIKALNDGSSMPYACALAFVELSEASFLTGDEEEGLRYAHRARSLAEAHRYYQLLFRLDSPPSQPVVIEFSTRAEEVVYAVEHLEGAELVGAGA